MKILQSGMAALLAAFAVAVAPSFALANKANDTLVYASDSEPENVSPYHNNLREGVIIARNVTRLAARPGRSRSRTRGCARPYPTRSTARR